MNKIFKFWLWKISNKAKKLNADEKIAYLANELIKTLRDSGRSIERDPDFGNLTIWVHNLTNEKSSVELESNNWRFKTKPTFEKF